ncbi:3-oxoacyl-[acyl-carrier-protein] synthase 3 [Limihaloglobus sulfuriphilus]|uniref:3-oxoacyl-[acyl-carrier-protein] synthase 3 n=1 Tax=Limihaloglobus sulfuriphilus TaxID=1851148 RepID=A0A1Q2MIF3_9BACT|nr:ketoacyl-ACP synthase III [Limihaloglobus sulfuriphilus]AQQ72444.1 3-oxoacyl-[acyl-carrier-protein] synthase 3 [Limihaloglobus sulfuriphilus]
MGARIRSIVYYLPTKTLGNDELERELPGFDRDKVERRLGIRNRHIAAEGETSLDMGEKACQKLFDEEGFDRGKIDFLLLCTQSPDYFLPTSACILQDRLGLRTDIGALDYNLGCSGYVYGLAMAKSFVETGIAQNVLLVTSETYSKHLYQGDRGNRTLFGDAAAATIIEKAPSDHFHEFVLGTDGSGAQNLIVDNGGFRNPTDPQAKPFEYSPGNWRTKNHLYMNGPKLFTFAINTVPVAVREVLRKNQMTIEDVDYVICHQANKHMLNYICREIGADESKFHIDVADVGNTVSATIPIALKDAMDQGVVQRGDRVLLVGFGVGYSWGAVVVEL